MPHSSGGGSHHGGSHHSSHHSSSHGSSHSSRSSYPRVSTTYFSGASRYSYRDRHHRTHYIYCAGNPRKAYRPRWFMIIFYIPFIIALYFMSKDIVHIPKLPDNYDSYIYIEDNLSIIKDRAALESELTDFYNKTHVTPSVITVYDEQWTPKYRSLESYALARYKEKFHNDETHWLVVYSYPKGDSDNWKWEGMIGDDTGGVITASLENKFTDTMHRNLRRVDKGFTFDRAVADAFSEVAEKSRKTTIQWGQMPVLLMIGGFILIHAVLMIGLTPKNLNYSRAVPDPDPINPPYGGNIPQAVAAAASVLPPSIASVIPGILNRNTAGTTTTVQPGPMPSVSPQPTQTIPQPTVQPTAQPSAQYDPAQMKPIRCKYCNSTVIPNGRINCPNCNAILDLSNRK